MGFNRLAKVINITPGKFKNVLAMTKDHWTGSHSLQFYGFYYVNICLSRCCQKYGCLHGAPFDGKSYRISS